MIEQDFSTITTIIRNTQNLEQAKTLLKLTAFASEYEKIVLSASAEAEGVKTKKAAPFKGEIKFTRKEIAQLPRDLQLYFIHNNIIVRYRLRHEDGLFQARFKRFGYNINIASRDYEVMKQKFINEFNRQTALMNKPAIQIICPQTYSAPQTSQDILFSEYGEEWLDTKKSTTKPSTYKDYERTLKKDLLPLFGKYRLSEINRAMLQKELFRVFKETPRKAEKMHLQLSCIFDMAQDDFQIPSPMKKVELPYREQKRGCALTKAEERTLVDYCTTKPELAATSALLALYMFGLRTSELASLKQIDENWVECVTSKELLGKNAEIRRIPITPNAKKFIGYVDFTKASTTIPRTISTTLNRIFPRDKVKGHHPHELRYTFITRCKECGVNPELVMLWDGHEEDKDVKSSKVDRGYTTYSEEYQLKQAKLVDYEI